MIFLLHHFTHVFQKLQSYDVRFLRYGVRQAEFFVILGHLLPFQASENPGNQNFEKLRKTPWYIIILHMYTINDNHKMYGSWDMKHDGRNFLSFWTVFCLFNPPNNPKNQHFESILSFYTCVPWMTIM